MLYEFQRFDGFHKAYNHRFRFYCPVARARPTLSQPAPPSHRAEPSDHLLDAFTLPLSRVKFEFMDAPVPEFVNGLLSDRAGR